MLFGRQDVNTLQLCAMLKKKAESGYYQVEHSVQFGMYDSFPDLLFVHLLESTYINNPFIWRTSFVHV